MGSYHRDLLLFIAGGWLVLLAIGAVISAVLVPLLIRWQRGRSLGQQIYEDGPVTHTAKQGTPTMGGLAFVTAAIAGGLMVLIVLQESAFAARGLFATLVLVVAAGAVGFADDFLIVIRRRPLGLRARVKFGLLLLLALGFVAYESSLSGAHLQLWFGHWVALPTWLWWFLSVGAVVGAANAVNLTDGLDGLAAGAAIPTLVIIGLSTVAGMLLAAPVVGACAGFLFFNRYPARIFMGDTGSLALGALMGGLAVQGGFLLLLPLAGIVFVVEAASVILQVLSFQSTGKRIFRMTPLHHHFELSGRKEWQVTAAFTAASWIAAAIVAAGLLTIHAVMGTGVLHAE